MALSWSLIRATPHLGRSVLCASATLQLARGRGRGKHREQHKYCSKESRARYFLFSLYLHDPSSPSAASFPSEEAGSKHREWDALFPGPAATEPPRACKAFCKCPPGPASTSHPPTETGITIPTCIQRRLHHNCFLNSEAFEVKAKVCFYACIEPSPLFWCLQESLRLAGAHLTFYNSGVISVMFVLTGKNLGS